MKYAIPDELLDLAREEVADCGERLRIWDGNDPETLRMARRISVLAPVLLMGVLEREIVDPTRTTPVTSLTQGPPTKSPQF